MYSNDSLQPPPGGPFPGFSDPKGFRRNGLRLVITYIRMFLDCSLTNIIDMYTCICVCVFKRCREGLGMFEVCVGVVGVVEQGVEQV